MLLTDLRELKTQLEIDPADTSEDKKLNFFIEQGSEWICQAINRPGLSYKQRTEYYNGTGTPKLTLKSRPVFTTPTIQLWFDRSGFYGAPADSFNTGTTLTYGTDFYLKVDQEDGTSRSGILVRVRDFWYKPRVREGGYLYPYVGEDFGSIKVTYTAGYTVDSLPAVFRQAMNILVAKMRSLMPLGMELSSESYEERGISYKPDQRDYLIGLIYPMIAPYRNFGFHV